LNFKIGHFTQNFINFQEFIILCRDFLIFQVLMSVANELGKSLKQSVREVNKMKIRLRKLLKFWGKMEFLFKKDKLKFCFTKFLN